MKRHIRCALEWENKVQTLQDKIKKLKNKKDTVQEDVDDAIRRGNFIHVKVTRWLRDADKAIGEAEELVQQKEEAKNLKTRYQLGKQADERAWAITRLYYDEKLKLMPNSPVAFVPSALNCQLLPSRVLVLNQIMVALTDPSVNMIGIYGVGGVGKTTLAKTVSARAQDEELFDNVIMIPVSRFPNSRRIQEEIASFLGLQFDTEEVVGRSRQLYERLKRAKLLIFLDDVWQKIDLHSVGIPFGDEPGCKFLVTSRSKEVLSTEMGSQKVFLLDLLNGEESLHLFQSIAPEVEDPILKATAIEITKRCAGVPLLIVQASSRLKNVAPDSWADMLKQLPEFKKAYLPERVSKVMESSFENLPGEELKSLFLLCASYEQPNVPIQHLLTAGMCLHLFGNVSTIKEASSALSTMVHLLEKEGWLLYGDNGWQVRVHDVVRDAAMAIVSRFPNWFVGAGQTWLSDWPDKDCTRISVRVCDIHDLPANIQCPQAELFQLSSEDLCLEFPDLFFEGLAKLNSVGFTGIDFVTKLPSSLGCLRNLDALSLNRCRLENISVIGELVELKFLSFAESDIVELPRKIEALTQLKLLDLSNCSKLQVVPANVISKLILLEELLMCNTNVRWDEEGNASLVELGNLSYLSSLAIQVVNPELIEKFSSFCNGLHSYKIIIGNEHGQEKYERSRMLKLIKCDANILSEDGFKVMLRRIKDLCLDEVSRMGRHVWNGLIQEGFPQLRNLCIKNDYGIHHLLQQGTWSLLEVFPVLKSLRLDNLHNLEMISAAPVSASSFLRLQTLRISDCGRLKSLFSCLYGYRVDPQEIEVESCVNLKSIINEGWTYIQFAGLTSLKLKNLPQFKGFHDEKVNNEKTGVLFNDKIDLPKLKILEVTKCQSLKYVSTRSNVNWLRQLERLKINDCELVEEIIWHKETEQVEEVGINEIVFPKLSYASLQKLTHLKSFSCGFIVEFPTLVELSIHNCPAMVINTSSEGGENAKMYNLDGMRFPRLMQLNIRNGYGSQHALNLDDVKRLESLYIDELRSLSVSNCNQLTNLLSFSSAKCYTQILEVKVRSCHKMEAFVGGRSEDESLQFTQLRSLKFENLPHLLRFCELEEGIGQPEVLFNKMVSFPNLMSLVVDKCNTLKYVFTLPVVKSLVQLTKLEISNCEFVEAIIQSNEIEESKEEIINTVLFHKLVSLSLYGLPNAKTFGSGYGIKFPFVREIFVECPAMKNFVPKFSDRNNNYNGDEYLFNELVTFSNLESVIVRNMGMFRYLWHENYVSDDSFFKLKSLKVANCSRLSVVFLANAFRRIQKLETLHLSSCDKLKEIFQSEETECGRLYITEEYALRDVQVLNLASLKYVFPNTMAHSLLRLEQLAIQNCNIQVVVEELQEMYTDEVVKFPQLISLKLKDLHYLFGFCNKKELGFGGQVLFPRLKGLDLCQCKNFKYAFTPTMVNSLIQLEKLEINDCELVEEIIQSRQCDEVDKIVFPKLEYLSLKKLPNLKTFDFGYPVEFQSLKELSISYCPVLENFVSKFLDNGSGEYLFNEMVIFSSLERMEVCHAYSFEYLWDGQFIAADSFLNLKSLRIEYCSKLRVIFPSNICTSFQGLETLHICCCPRAEEVYQFEESNSLQAFSLQDLDIWNLPSLKRIWSNDPPGASTFEYLQSVKVVSCKDLLFVFPKSIARRLLQLQHLKVGDSHMEVIIANTNVEESDFLFPQLSILQLENLYEMRSLHERPYNFECPKLKQLDIYGCNEAMNFFSQIKSLQLHGSNQVLKLGSKISAYHKEKSLSPVKKELIRNLEEVTLDDQGLKLILSVDRRVRFSKLKQVTVRSLDEESVPLLFGFLRRCSLKKLVFMESYLEDIFLEVKMAEQLMLQNLEVVGDDNLKHIFKKVYRTNTVLENLLTLKVEFCESMINIAPSSASFKNLTSLNVSACFKMKNLVTVSTARNMENLRELKISKCSMMEEIVENNSDARSISFDKLKFLELHDLPTLKSFSSGIYDLEFPLLKQVVVKKCFAMKNFCRRQVGTPKLEAIQFQGEKCWKGDLNATIAYLEKSRAADLTEKCYW